MSTFLKSLVVLLITGVAFAGEPQRLPPPETTAASPATPASHIDTAVRPAAALSASETPPWLTPPGCPAADYPTPDYKLDFVFDKGLGIVSTEPPGKKNPERPNSIYIGARMQHRYTGFTRDEETFTDSTGTTRDILNRSDFDFERVRINIQGTALDPRLKYNMSFDGDSDGGSNADVLFYFFQFDKSDAVKLRFGRWRTIYGREWLLSSRYLRLADRSMATEFFRPTFSEGVWLLGDVNAGPRKDSALHYELGMTNGLATSTRRPAQLDDNLAVSGTLRWDPWGKFGKGFQDFDWHKEPVVQIGLSGVFSKTDDRSDVGFPLGDDGGVLRLTDGTLLAAEGALAPGVSVVGVRTLQASADAAMKWRGWSVGGEYFLRSLQDFTATGALPVTQLTQRGYRAEGGVFLVPHKLDVNFQTSYVTGRAGRGYTYSAGFNYYLFGKDGNHGPDRLNKITFDVTDVTDAPRSTSTADLIAGDNGQLFRLQIQLGY